MNIILLTAKNSVTKDVKYFSNANKLRLFLMQNPEYRYKS